MKVYFKTDSAFHAYLNCSMTFAPHMGGCSVEPRLQRVEVPKFLKSQPRNLDAETVAL